jgi:alpha/beta superfamily hydrolase
MIQSDPLIASGARRVQPDGSTERAEFRGPEGERMLVHTTIPASSPRGALVVCSPLLGECMRNYRREVLLARLLGSHGFAVVRFHYRFTGNSDGGEESLSFDSMREDALDCVEHLQGEAPGIPLFLLGTRWGALIAASAAAAHPGADLVLWEPLLEAHRFFREAFRSRLVKDMRDGVEHPATGQQLESSLHGGEPVEVPAHRIHPELHRSSSGRSLTGELGDARRSILAIQVGPTGSVRTELSGEVDRWRAGGLEVQVSAVRGEESWWLVDERWDDEAKRPMTREVMSITTNWMEERLENGRPNA